MRSGRIARLHIRLTEEERAAIRRRASEAGLAVSAFVRERALSEAGRPLVRTDVALLRKIYRSLRGCASNLNQCTRELHAFHDQERVSVDLTATLEAVARASDEVARLISDARKNC